MCTRPSWVPENMAPQKVVPMPSRLASQATRSARSSLAAATAPARVVSMSSPSRWASAAQMWSMATVEARSPAAAPPMPSATASIVAET